MYSELMKKELNKLIQRYLASKLGLKVSPTTELEITTKDKGWENSKDFKFVILEKDSSNMNSKWDENRFAQGYVSYYPTMCGAKNINQLYSYKKGFGRLIYLICIIHVAMYRSAIFTASHPSMSNPKHRIHRLVDFTRTVFGKANVSSVIFNNRNTENMCEHITVDISKLTDAIVKASGRASINSDLYKKQEVCDAVISAIVRFLDSNLK